MNLSIVLSWRYPLYHVHCFITSAVFHLKCTELLSKKTRETTDFFWNASSIL